MPNTQQERMEDISTAYVKAVAAKCGYTYEIVGRDNDGVDGSFQCKGFPAPVGCLRRSPSIDIQLKSTYARITKTPNGDYKFKLESHNYNILTQNDRMTPIILVVLHMQRDENKWVQHCNRYLKITKCAYWMSFSGMNVTQNRTSITVTIPQENVFSPDALTQLMIRVSNNEEI